LAPGFFYVCALFNHCMNARVIGEGTGTRQGVYPGHLAAVVVRITAVIAYHHHPGTEQGTQDMSEFEKPLEAWR